MQKILFNIRDNTITEETKNYINDKFLKLEPFLNDAISITVNIYETKSHLGQFKDSSLEILIKLPNAFVKVENKGHNINKLVDKTIPILQRRLKRYHTHENKWDNKALWKSKQIEKSVIVENEKADYNFEPKIKTKYLLDNTPIHPAEAVERMELLGHHSFLFKNIENNNYGMIYKREKGGYGLVIPKI
jgi:putative sigma-54 modulation protein